MPTNLKLRACRVAKSDGAHWPRVFAHAAFLVFEVSPGRSAGHRRPARGAGFKLQLAPAKAQDDESHGAA